MRRRSYLFSCAGVLAAGCKAPVSSNRPLYHNLLDTLNSRHLGFGYDYFTPNTKHHYPMAYALIASSEATRYEKTGNETAAKRATSAVKWLFNKRDRDEDGVIGWGLPVAWDAFGDGSKNEPHHTYTITTSLVGHAILDVVNKCPGEVNITSKEYIKSVERSVDIFINNNFYNQSSNGICFWYSVVPRDSDNVLNPSSMFAALLQRLASNDQISKRKSRMYRNYADRAIRYLISHREVRDGALIWPYIANEKGDNQKYNDGVHAAYVADGILTYLKFGGALEDELKKKNILGGLKLFRQQDSLSRYINRQHPPRVWGIGHLLYVATKFFPESGYGDFLLSQANQYRNDPGFEPRQGTSNQGFGAVRHTAHLMNGISVHQF